MSQINPSSRQTETQRWVRTAGPPFPPEIQELGYDNPRHALTLPEHIHPESFEFVVVEKGHAAWEIGHERFETRAGDVFHTQPGEMHRGGYEVIEPSRFWWIQVVVPHPATRAADGRWMAWPIGDMRPLVEGLWALARVQHGGPLISAPLRRLRSAVERGDATSPLECRVALLDFLVRMLQPNSRRQVPEDVLKGMESIITRMHAAPHWHPRIPELAQGLGISVSHFHRIFRDHTGLSPMEYMERIRIAEAAHRLETSHDSILQIALDLGFSTSQHFATVFRRITGQSPTGWRGR